MTDPQGFECYLRDRRTAIDSALNTGLPTPPACPPLIADAMRYSLLAGGKRLRPILTLAAAEAVAERDHPARIDPVDTGSAAAMPAACAVELIHTYSLIHDELPAMDDDTVRRGRPTAHVVYGDAVAILAGDALLTHAFGVLARPESTETPARQARRLRAMARLADAAGAAGMVGGQILDIGATDDRSSGRSIPHVGHAALRDIHERKTGALIGAAAAMGAILAGGDEETLAAIDAYSTQLGLAFQIVDDILDVEGTETKLGKTVGKDAVAGKPTYPALHGLTRSRALAFEAAAAAADALARATLGGRLSEITEWVISRRH